MPPKSHSKTEIEKACVSSIEVSDISRFEQEVLVEIKEKHPDILESIKIEKELTKENTIKLKSFFDDFLSKFKN